MTHDQLELLFTNQLISNDIALLREHYETLDSTQLFARKNLHELRYDSWKLWTANAQTKGIGQNNNTWESPPNLNVYATYGLLLQKQLSSKMIHIPLVAALSVIQTLKSKGIRSTFKWPNDILVDGEKVSGVLSESYTKNNESISILIGVGINVNSEQRNFIWVDQPATSIKLEKNLEYDVENILSIFSYYLTKNISTLLRKDFSYFHKDLSDALEKFGERPISFKSQNKTTTGMISGINHLGELVLKSENTGKENSYNNGRIVLIS